MRTATYLLALCALFCASILAGIASTQARGQDRSPGQAATEQKRDAGPDLPEATSAAAGETAAPFAEVADAPVLVQAPVFFDGPAASLVGAVPLVTDDDSFVLEGELVIEDGDGDYEVEVLESQRRTVYLGRGAIASAIVAYNQWRPATRLVWPAYGPVTSHYRLAHPLGIDIAQAEGPVVAATDGTVTFAGGDPCCSYGLHVIIVSPARITTVYGHLESLRVQTGDAVLQGQVLGLVGCTGKCTGPHLHFEVLRNGRRQNPLLYLP